MVRYSGYEGRLGVPAFFAISGFVIPYAMHRADYTWRTFGRFLLRRVTRLEPPYLASIAVSVAVGLVLGHRYTPGQIFAHLMYLIPLTPFSWVNDVYWTLAYEFVFYVAAGLLFPLLWRRNILFIIGVGVTATWLIPEDHEFRAIILCFVIGIVACRRYVDIDRPVVTWASLAVTIVLMLLWRGGGPAVAAGATALFILNVSLPAWRPLAQLGSISYSLYLLHIPLGAVVVGLLRPLGKGPLFEFAASGAGLATSLVSASILYLLVDRPATRLAHRVSIRRVQSTSSSSEERERPRIDFAAQPPAEDLQPAKSVRHVGPRPSR